MDFIWSLDQLDLGTKPIEGLYGAKDNSQLISLDEATGLLIKGSEMNRRLVRVKLLLYRHSFL